MIKKFSKQNDDDDYLSEFRQKIAVQKEEEMAERQKDLHRSRNSFIGTLAGIILAGIVGWILLLPRFAEQENAQIPVIRRQVTAIKIRPNEPGGMEILNQDKSIYSLVEKKEVESTQIESLLPQPEEPKMPTIVPEPEKTTADEMPTQSNDLAETSMEELIESVQTNSDKKVVIPEKPADLNVQAAPAKPQPKTEEKKTPEQVKQPVVTAVKESANGLWQVQLIASSNKEAVENSWSSLRAKHKVLASLPHEIESAGTGSDKPVYRLKAGSFATREEADNVCAQVKKSGGSCLVKKK